MNDSGQIGNLLIGAFVIIVLLALVKLIRQKASNKQSNVTNNPGRRSESLERRVTEVQQAAAARTFKLPLWPARPSLEHPPYAHRMQTILPCL